MNRPSLLAHSAAETAGSAVGTATVPSPETAPTEKISEPPIGCASTEMTRQLSTCVPCPSPSGSVTVSASPLVVCPSRSPVMRTVGRNERHDQRGDRLAEHQLRHFRRRC